MDTEIRNINFKMQTNENVQLYTNCNFIICSMKFYNKAFINTLSKYYEVSK